MQAIDDKKIFQIDGFWAIIILLFVDGLLVIASGLNPIGIILAVIITILCVTGFIINNPNQAKIIIFFGKYLGTVRDSGFLWTVPLSSASAISLKIINFNTKHLKVNDLRGNPIEVGAVVVWRVENVAKAAFNVDDFIEFVANQSEIAIRSIVAKYPYDSESEHSLRGNADEITEKLKEELQSKLSMAGILIEDMKLSHLAYAPEIASAMLRKQQAEAIFQAKKYLVDNALSIVGEVLSYFEKNGNLKISDDKKAEMINNLLVTLVSDKDASPVVKVGL